MPRKLKIVFASSEVSPYSKTGGLADVAETLPKALARLGHEVKIVTPFYRATRKGRFDIRKFSKKIFVQLGDRIIEGEIATAPLTPQVDVIFVVKDEYYDRDELYQTPQGDYKDNAERFIFFSKAVLSTLEELDMKPDILHCHDWQTGLVSTLLKTIESSNLFFAKTKTIFTIHNLAYQGLFWHYDMPLTNLPWEVFTPEGIEFYGKINLLKAGLIYSDVLTTVSRKYSEEIKTVQYGCGLQGVLAKRAKDLYGIPNGMDDDEWHPERDAHIAAHYSWNDLSGKQKCKADLIRELDLSAVDSNTPLMGMVSRLADQKGFDILAEAMDELLSEPCGFVLLGTGEERYEKFFQELALRYPGRVGVRIGFDEPLAHRIEAGCDFFLMPSQFEPCGLNQLYSLKYGTIPIVRATGGLDDAIESFDAERLRGNGFKFQDYASDALLEKVREALRAYRNGRSFQELVKNAMRCDFSWESSAKEYEEVYFRALRKEGLKESQIKRE